MAEDISNKLKIPLLIFGPDYILQNPWIAFEYQYL